MVSKDREREAVYGFKSCLLLEEKKILILLSGVLENLILLKSPHGAFGRIFTHGGGLKQNGRRRLFEEIVGVLIHFTLVRVLSPCRPACACRSVSGLS